MVTKEEMSDFLNELLKTDIDFSKLTKEDLEKVLKVLSDPSNLIQLGVKQLRTRTKKEILNRTLKDFLDKPLLEELGLTANKDGPLGFGILPRIMGKKPFRSKTSE